MVVPYSTCEVDASDVVQVIVAPLDVTPLDVTDEITFVPPDDKLYVPQIISVSLAIVAVAVCEPDALNILYMLVVGEDGSGAIVVYPDPGVMLFDEDTPQEAKSAVPVGLIVELTEPFGADPVPTAPSTTSDPPAVS